MRFAASLSTSSRRAKTAISESFEMPGQVLPGHFCFLPVGRCNGNERYDLDVES
jgi:hypothetical protein